MALFDAVRAAQQRPVVTPTTAPKPTPLASLVAAPGAPTPTAPATAVAPRTAPATPAIAPGYQPAPLTPTPVTKAAPPGQPSIQPPVTPPAGGDFVTDFGPGNDLRFNQINPLATARLKQLQGGVDTSAGAVSSAPDLSTAAGDQFKLLGEQTAEARKRGLQDIGRAAATFGRLGSGAVTTDIGNLEDVLRTREEQARRGLAYDTATNEAANRRANLSSLSGLEGQVSGQEAAARGEVRGERGYQADTAQQTLDNQIRQRALEEALTQGEHGRQVDTAQLGLQGATLQSNLAQGEQQAAAGGLSDLALQESLKNYGAPPTATATAPTATAPAGAPQLNGPAPGGYRWVNGRLMRSTTVTPRRLP